MQSNVSDKVWKAIFKLGLVAKDKAKDYWEKIVDMECSDKDMREFEGD